jgi:hypothetical protein
MSEGSKERSPEQLAKSRRDYLAQVKMLTMDERTQEAAMISKALGIKAPKGIAAAGALDAAQGAYIRLLGTDLMLGVRYPMRFCGAQSTSIRNACASLLPP